MLLDHDCTVLYFRKLLFDCWTGSLLTFVVNISVMSIFFTRLGGLACVTQFWLDLAVKILKLFMDVLVSCVAAFESRCERVLCWRTTIIFLWLLLLEFCSGLLSQELRFSMFLKHSCGLYHIVGAFVLKLTRPLDLIFLFADTVHDLLLWWPWIINAPQLAALRAILSCHALRFM